MGEPGRGETAGSSRTQGVVAGGPSQAVVFACEPATDGTAVSEAVAGAYSAYHAELAGFLRRETREAEVAEDIAQEAFLRLQRELLAGRVPSNLRAWLFRVAVNLAISRGRRLAVARRRLAETWPEAGEDESPEMLALRDERAARLDGALGDLAPEARLALMLAAQGFSGREVARALGRTEVATRTVLCRARVRLRARLLSEELATEERR